jgi:DNA replication protein DnaC
VQERLIKRFKSAMIPDQFQQATFADYQVENPVQAQLYKAATAYVDEFGQPTNGKGSSLGFIAVYGESRFKLLSPAERMKMKQTHNNFGLGKTHLQIAIVRQLIKKGISVLVVSDVALMDELMVLKKGHDSKKLDERLHDLIHMPVLAWDDMGKSAPTEAKQAMYFHIINERYKAQRPILYSSNEDQETLELRIGGAATSRLFGMSYGRIFRVEGPDYRLTGKGVTGDGKKKARIIHVSA